MFKKMGAVSIALVLSVAVLFTGCGGKKASDAVDVPGYKGIEVEKEKVEKVTDKALNDAVQNRIKGQMQYKEVKGAVKDNYRVNIDYTGKKDGKSFAGGSAKGYTLTLGSNQFIKDLENGIVGMKKGQKKTINATFPKSYHSKELAGKKVTFDVKVNRVEEPVKPKNDAAYYKKLSQNKAKNMDELKKVIKKELEKANENRAEEMMKSNAWSKVMAKVKVKKLPEDDVKAAEDIIKGRNEQLRKQQKQSMAQYLKQRGIDEKAYNKEVTTQAENEVKTKMAYMFVCEAEKIEPSSDDIKKRVEEYKKMGYDDKSIKKYTGKNLEDTVKDELYQKAAKDFVYKHAKKVEKKKPETKKNNTKKNEKKKDNSKKKKD